MTTDVAIGLPYFWGVQVVRRRVLHDQPAINELHHIAPPSHCMHAIESRAVKVNAIRTIGRFVKKVTTVISGKVTPAVPRLRVLRGGIMNVTSYKVTIIGVLFSVGVLWAGVGRSVAAEGPDGLQPIPENSPATTALTPNGRPNASGVHEEASVASADEEPCTEFCGTPVCSPPGRFWARADYLMWWTSGMKLPPLVATGTVDNPTILYGNSTVDNGGRSGYRTTFGMWMMPATSMASSSIT